ncbi:hypothetical protein MRS44_018487 [Fusarium solani]|uniref:uncharacterized protein n=1 Tax=Fusarium solani TaxID=169388 RepID=UPI0032C46090|nr:hypothetical protein MRS44_018487 [Fusarium solani]
MHALSNLRDCAGATIAYRTHHFSRNDEGTSGRPMTSQPIPGEALNASDLSSYITEKNSRREQPNDVMCRPVFNPATRCGAYFLPMEMPSRDPIIKPLPHTPLDLFQLFLPYSLVERWVQYTNRWVKSLLQDRHLKPAARLKSWVETSVAEVYIWLAILIYIGIHKEATIHSHWETSHPEHHAPDHPIRRLMTYDRFQLLQRHIRVFNPFNIADTRLPRTPPTNLAVDECMTRFTGRSYETTKVPNKPTPLGFKSWVRLKKAPSCGGFGASQRRDMGQLPCQSRRVPVSFLVSYAVREEGGFIRL